VAVGFHCGGELYGLPRATRGRTRPG
jgi:hypothetical protein